MSVKLDHDKTLICKTNLVGTYREAFFLGPTYIHTNIDLGIQRKKQKERKKRLSLSTPPLLIFYNFFKSISSLLLEST